MLKACLLSLLILGQSPAEPPLTVRTEVPGTGTQVSAGDRVTIHFVIRNPQGQVLADSERRGLTYSFVAGTDKVPKILSEGVLGMRVGETRLVMAQPEAVYGAAGSPPFVPGATPLRATLRLLRIQN